MHFIAKILCGVALVGGNISFAIPKKNAELVVLNKVSARSQVLNISVGEATLIGPFSVIVEICDKAPPESGAYIDIVQEGNTVFKGWMFASDPAINNLEHPVYDIWLQRCL